MRALRLILIFTILFQTNYFADAQNFSDKGFSFQAYARNDEGAALSSENITVRFTITNLANSLAAYQETHALTTDPFGVFRATVGKGTPVGSDQFQDLRFGAADYALLVEVSPDGSSFTTISNQELLSVPYAKAADNGVPVGAILPYASGTIPDGWLLCNGSTIPTEFSELRSLVGNNTPDLRGRFLRGNPASGRSLLTFEDDAVQSHNHGFSGTTSTNGNHNHNHTDENRGSRAISGVTDGGSATAVGGVTSTTRQTNTTGNHNHSFSGSTNNGNSGRFSGETRPDNISVNYIIRAR